MRTIYKEFSFDAAHFLPNYKGPCSRTHGHTYRLFIGVTDVKESFNKDMIMDFAQLKALVKSIIIDRYDHYLLNDLSEYKSKRPTAENMVEEIWKRLIDYLPNLYEVKLYETPTSYVVYRGGK